MAVEVTDRVRVLQELQRVRAELHDARATLQTLQATAWPEETDRTDESCNFHISCVTDVGEAAALADLVRSASGTSRAKVTEEEMKRFIERRTLLLCSTQNLKTSGGDLSLASAGVEAAFSHVAPVVEEKADIGGASQTEHAQYCGCCAVAAPNDLCSELSHDTNIPTGQLVFIAVKQDMQRAGVGRRLLAAAEELLASEHQCGEARLKLDAGTPPGSADEDYAYNFFQHAGYSQHSAVAPSQMVLTKTFALGFISRSLTRKLTKKEEALAEQLASLQAHESLTTPAVPPSTDADVHTQQTAALEKQGEAGLGQDQISPLPHDICVGIMLHLGARDLGTVTQVCRILAQEASDNDVWQRLFTHCCWPPSEALLAFAEDSVDSPGGIDWRSRFNTRAKASPVIVVDIGRGYTKYGLVHSLRGRPGGDGRPPNLVQLCSSPTHPPDCDHDEQLPFIHSQLDAALVRAAQDPEDDLHRAALGPSAVEPVLEPGRFAVLHGLTARAELNGTLVRLASFETERGRWKVCSVNIEAQTRQSARSDDLLVVLPERLKLVNRAQEFPLLIGEPFAATASGGAGQMRSGLTRWALATQAELGRRAGPVRIIPQAQMALWAFGIDHGIVVNIGQSQTIALPVVCGEIVAQAAVGNDLGSAALTRLMLNVLHRRYPMVDSGVMTWCRDLKEQYCYVAPPVPSTTVKGVTMCTEPGALQRRLSLGDDYGVQQVQVRVPTTGQPIDLDKERILVPELMFDSSMSQGGPTLPVIILRCAEKVLSLGVCSQEALQALLRNIVLVGGAADLPGIRPRTEFELRGLLEHRASAELRSALRSPEDVFVLNPPLGTAGPLTSPRFVPFFGGCVRMAGSTLPSTGLVGQSDLGSDGTTEQILPQQRQIPAISAWMRRRFFHLNAPAIFRTGGGGGEDEVWGRLGWQALGNLSDSDPESEETEETDQVPQEASPVSPAGTTYITSHDVVQRLMARFARPGAQPVFQPPPRPQSADDQQPDIIE